MKDKIVVLAGPTAVGKTKISIDLAKRLESEIISADSMQVYRGMDIGTAKIKAEEMQGIRHHMIDILSPLENMDVYSFKERTKPILEDLIKRNKIPIIVGGTGFYIQAITKDINFSEETDTSYRLSLWEKDEDTLFDMLIEIDPEYAKTTHKNNKKRIVRALEFFKSEGYPLSEHNKDQMESESHYDVKYFVLTKMRETLYEDIEKRVDIMIKEGLIDEAKSIYDLGINENNTAYKALGYNELFMYFKGIISLEESVKRIKTNTRHFAKRQLTWFRREKNVIWIQKEDFKNDNEILEFMLSEINK